LKRPPAGCWTRSTREAAPPTSDRSPRETGDRAGGCHAHCRSVAYLPGPSSPGDRRRS
jgi:hypothetical protein